MPTRQDTPAFQSTTTTAVGSGSGSGSSRSDRVDPARRSRKGCLTCRTRKVKCDEVPGECGNCRKLSLVCKWAWKRDIPVNDIAYIGSPSPTLDRSGDGHPRRRSSSTLGLTTISCLACRTAKTKCSHLRPTCTRCINLDLECVYPRGDKRRRVYSDDGETSSPPPAAVASVPVERPLEHDDDDEQLLPKKSSPVRLDIESSLSSAIDVDQFLAAFFTHVYPVQANSFLHRGDLLQSVANRTASPLLVKAICTVSARYLNHAEHLLHPDGGEAPAQWAAEVKHVIIQDTETFSMSKLGAALLVVNHEWNCGRYASAWTLTALVVRIALAMSLNVNSDETAGLPWVFQESRRRLMWSVFCADAVASGGILAYTGCPTSLMEIDLPCSEYNFDVSLPVKANRLDEGPSQCEGLTAHFVRLMSLRSDILRYVKSISKYEVKPWEPLSTFGDCVRQLRAWHDNLAPELLFNPTNLYSRSARGELDPFIAIHCWYDQLYCVLYRIAIPGFDESAPSAYIADAPIEWVSNLRYGCYVRACSVQDKLRIMVTKFPSHKPSSWHFRMFAFEAVRNQLQYLPESRSDGHVPSEEDAAQRLKKRTDGFQILADVLSTMVQHSSCVYRTLQETLEMLSNHGYAVTSKVSESYSSLSLPPRSLRAPVRSNVPWIRRHVVDPLQVDEERRRVQHVSDNVTVLDPNNDETLYTEPMDRSLADANEQPQPQPSSPYLWNVGSDKITGTSAPTSSSVFTTNMTTEPYSWGDGATGHDGALARLAATFEAGIPFEWPDFNDTNSPWAAGTMTTNWDPVISSLMLMGHSVAGPGPA